MASMSNYFENKLVDATFRGVALTFPTTIAVALCTSAPTDASTGATIPEVANSGAYARVALNPSTTNWQDTSGGTAATSSGTGGTTANNATITFPTATGNWGTITHFAIVDSATYGAGNVLFWGALTSSQVINTGGVASFAAGALTVQYDN
jgi:hypothetical protein